MKIGVLGGSFDPIHIGHLLLGTYAYEQLNLDEVWFLPNGHPPHKQVVDMPDSARHRIEMVRLAVEEVPYFELSLHEASEETPSYSYRTLQEFHQLYPEDEFYFILGADSLFSIEHWRHFQEIFSNCILVAAVRNDINTDRMKEQIDYLQQSYGAKIILLQAPLVEISSTMIRERIAKQERITYMVPKVVEEYISAHHLYEKE